MVGQVSYNQRSREVDSQSAAQLDRETFGLDPNCGFEKPISSRQVKISDGCTQVETQALKLKLQKYQHSILRFLAESRRHAKSFDLFDARFRSWKCGYCNFGVAKVVLPVHALCCKIGLIH